MVMILTAQDDLSSNDVIDWLRFYNIPFVRISIVDVIKYSKIIINETKFDIEFSINELDIYKLSNFKAFWYRRSHYKIFVDKIFGNNKIADDINSHLYNEANEIHRLFSNYIEKRSINKHEDLSTNKLVNLKKAKDLDIKIPDTLITNNKKEVAAFLSKHETVITKNFSQGIFISEENKVFSSITKIVDSEVYEMLPDQFSYSLFQEGIEKLFELRIFFLYDTFYASAIFSQNDEKTAVDFRNYNWAKPNRTPPFKLPKEITFQLIKLMKAIDINCGSIDMLVTRNNQYVFLEVNPIGQFAQVSNPCNYYIEEKIASQLKKMMIDGTR
jgi:ATP-GRASP peptide maturase of grasp-with-spasm system